MKHPTNRCPAVTLGHVTDENPTAIDAHLLQGMEAELVITRAELAKAAAHVAEVEAELFAVAQRLTAKEAEHEAALNALKKVRDDLFEARGRIEELEKRPEPESAPTPSLAQRAVRKVVRTVKK